MPVNPTYPGVYLQELASGARTIAGVPTSITAFVGRFTRGPENVPVRVFNPGDFERAFGGLDRFRETSYGVMSFFQNGGGQALIVRVAPGAKCRCLYRHGGSADRQSVGGQSGRLGQ